MDDMQVVLVLLMAMQCDGATMVTITTLVSSHTHAHTEGRHGKRDSGGMRPPHNTTMWWLVGVAHDQPKSLVTAKCHHQHTHTKWLNHTTHKSTTLPCQSAIKHTPMPKPWNAKQVPSAPHWPPQIPPPHHQPPTTSKKDEGRRTSGGTKKQVHTSTKASQHNGHLVGSIGVEQVPPVMVTTTTHHHAQPQPMRVVLEETP